MTINLVILFITIMSMLFVSVVYSRLKALPEGDGTMVELSTIIRDGSRVFIKAEYSRIIPVVVAVTFLITAFIETTGGLTFIIGATMSSLACILGMRSATYANVRTTETARRTRSIGKTVQTAIRGGCICGLSVPTFGLFGLILVLFIFGEISVSATGHGLFLRTVCNPTLMRITTYSLGCSLVAMFNRVAGGNLTKAADISADLVGKCDFGFDEDDWRIPNTIADFIGDNVNDIAGNCSDLLESFVATIGGTTLIAATIAVKAGASTEMFYAMIMLPIIIAAIGLVGSITSIVFVLTHKAGDKPTRELDIATYIAAGFVVIGSFIACKVMLGNFVLFDDFRAGWLSPWIACIFGIASGVIIGKITEFYTGLDFRPVKILANMAREGTAFVITKGDAIGARSVGATVATIGLAMLGSYFTCGLYGIAIAALGMLAFVGTTVSIDAFGPVADNAGGITESCGLGEDIRKITDLLDAVGNTTAAIGKGFAIGSAAFATTSLIYSYLSSYCSGDLILNFASPVVFVGGLIGAAFISYFCAVLSDNTIDSAYAMAEAGKMQLLDKDVQLGKKKPDYNALIKLSTHLAMKKMVGPSTMALLAPVISGFLFGPDFLGGMLVGATLYAVPQAIYNSNSGGAFDNAKKYIEAGKLIYEDANGIQIIVKKGSDAHKSAVNGDTTGDTRKDVVAVDLDICIKMMSTVAVIIAPIVQNWNLMSLLV